MVHVHKKREQPNQQPGCWVVNLYIPDLLEKSPRDSRKTLQVTNQDRNQFVHFHLLKTHALQDHTPQLSGIKNFKTRTMTITYGKVIHKNVSPSFNPSWHAMHERLPAVLAVPDTKNVCEKKCSDCAVTFSCVKKMLKPPFHWAREHAPFHWQSCWVMTALSGGNCVRCSTTKEMSQAPVLCSLDGVFCPVGVLSSQKCAFCSRVVFVLIPGRVFSVPSSSFPDGCCSFHAEVARTRVFLLAAGVAG